MTRSPAMFAPTDDDQRVPGHLPNELPKSACLEDEELDEEAWMPGRWMPGEGEPMSPRDTERLGDKRAMETIDEVEDELDEAPNDSRDGMNKLMRRAHKRNETP